MTAETSGTLGPEGRRTCHAASPGRRWPRPRWCRCASLWTGVSRLPAGTLGKEAARACGAPSRAAHPAGQVLSPPWPPRCGTGFDVPLRCNRQRRVGTRRATSPAGKNANAADMASGHDHEDRSLHRSPGMRDSNLYCTNMAAAMTREDEHAGRRARTDRGSERERRLAHLGRFEQHPVETPETPGLDHDAGSRRPG